LNLTLTAPFFPWKPTILPISFLFFALPNQFLTHENSAQKLFASLAYSPTHSNFTTYEWKNQTAPDENRYMACSTMLKSFTMTCKGSLALERLKPRQGILRNLPLGPVEKSFRLKPVNAKRFPTFRVSAIMKLFYYAAINAVLFWLAQRSNRMGAVRPCSVKHPIALWAFQFDFVFCHKKQPQLLM
jgi:hypothetical protein